MRELRNLVERLMIMTPHQLIQPQDIPPPFNRCTEITEGLQPSLSLPTFREAKAEFEKAYIQAKLREFQGNISQTAEAIGLERSNLHKKIKAYGLERFPSLTAS